MCVPLYQEILNCRLEVCTVEQWVLYGEVCRVVLIYKTLNPENIMLLIRTMDPNIRRTTLLEVIDLPPYPYYYKDNGCDIRIFPPCSIAAPRKKSFPPQILYINGNIFYHCTYLALGPHLIAVLKNI